jgi:hypothetical protein
MKMLSRFSIPLAVVLSVGGTTENAVQVFAPASTLAATNTEAQTPIRIPKNPLWSVRDCPQLAELEAEYILSCQENNPADPAYGAINNVSGAPTWVVPGEVAMATLGLDLAADILDDPSYRSRALLALAYLIRVQQSDGAWFNQYNGASPVDPSHCGDPQDPCSKSPHQTAEVMLALYKLDDYPDGYEAMKKGAQYLLEGQHDDGLLGAGKNPQGIFQSWRWTHDNAYAYWGLRAAELWAARAGETSLASTYAASAQRILQGINTRLYKPGTGPWHIAVDADGIPQWFSNMPNLPSWIQYAPQMLDLPATGVNSTTIGGWIHGAFQKSDGSCIGYSWDVNLKERKYPGLSFQAALAWYDTGNTAYADAAFDWAAGSGLWQTTLGGWIDWVEVSPNPGGTAPEWQRFIDTSFYSIAACAGGYDFRVPHGCPLKGLPLYDFNGDCRTDIAVYRPATGGWYIRNQYSTYYGSAGDKPVPGDYNGDETTDIAVFRPATGAWYIRNQFSAYYGVSTDIPVPGDYDGDGTTDIAVFRPSTGAWYIRNQFSVYYGQSTDIPVPGDYDGDGTTEVAVYRPSTGAWYVRGMTSVYYGQSTDIPVPGDYDGDGTTEIAVYRPATGAWYIRGMTSASYGVSTDRPVPGDYNGDGTTDIAVFRPSTGAWYIRGQYSAYYGASGDIPLPELSTGKAE